VHLVTRDHFRLREKDGGHTIRSATSETSRYTQLNLMALSFIKAEIWPVEFLHITGIRILDIFCSCDFDLDPMTLLYQLDPYFLEIYRMFKYELTVVSSYLKFKAFESYRLTHIHIAYIHTERQTDRHDRNYIPRRFAGGERCLQATENRTE